jgi:hypothetical protein
LLHPPSQASIIINPQNGDQKSTTDVSHESRETFVQYLQTYCGTVELSSIPRCIFFVPKENDDTTTISSNIIMTTAKVIKDEAVDIPPLTETPPQEEPPQEAPLKEAPPPWHSVALLVAFLAFCVATLPSLASLDEVATLSTFTSRIFPQYLSLKQLAYIRLWFALTIWWTSFHTVFIGNGYDERIPRSVCFRSHRTDCFSIELSPVCSFFHFPWNQNRNNFSFHHHHYRHH